MMEEEKVKQDEMEAAGRNLRTTKRETNSSQNRPMMAAKGKCRAISNDLGSQRNKKTWSTDS